MTNFYKSMRVVFETDGETDFANATVLREDDETTQVYNRNVKIFMACCVLGLLDEDNIFD